MAALCVAVVTLADGTQVLSPDATCAQGLVVVPADAFAAMAQTHTRIQVVRMLRNQHERQRFVPDAVQHVVGRRLSVHPSTVTRVLTEAGRAAG